MGKSMTRKKNLSARIREKVDEAGGPAAVRRKMGIAVPSGTYTDSRLLKNIADGENRLC